MLLLKVLLVFILQSAAFGCLTFLLADDNFLEFMA